MNIPSMHNSDSIKDSFMPFLLAMKELAAQGGIGENLLQVTLKMLLRQKCPWPWGSNMLLSDENANEAMFYLQEHLAHITASELWKKHWPHRDTMEPQVLAEILLKEDVANPVLARTLFPSYRLVDHDYNPFTNVFSNPTSTENLGAFNDALTEAILTTRCFFRVESTPLFGAIYHRYQRDDQLWFLRGLSIPVFLRPRGGVHFELVGAAYVHNYMHGRILETEWAQSERKITLV
jgi:hypothetical protein